MEKVTKMDVAQAATGLTSAITAGIVCLFWWDIRTFKQDTKKTVNQCITETQHTLICENANLKVLNKMDKLENKVDAIHTRLDKMNGD